MTKRESLSMATIALRLHVTQFLAEKVTQYRVSAEAISCETFYGRRHPAAMTLVQEELNKQGTISHISDAVEDRIRLEVDLGNELNLYMK
ncbi:hypothetical protein M3O75_31980 (plasmid) [Klebsiella pneumoniae]|nr:hypothetical protein [Klebsiella pneumoniae]